MNDSNKGFWAELGEEAGELFMIFVREAGIKRFSKKLSETFIAYYFLLKIKWAIEDLLLIFTECCLLILLWKAEFTINVAVPFKIIFMLSVHTMFKSRHRLKGYCHGQDAAHVLQRICDKHPDYYISEEDSHGRGSEQLQGREEGEEDNNGRD